MVAESKAGSRPLVKNENARQKSRQKKMNPESQSQFPSRRSPAVLYTSERTEMLAYIDPVDQPSKCPEEFWRLEQPTTVVVIVVQGIIGRRIAEGPMAQGKRRRKRSRKQTDASSQTPFLFTPPSSRACPYGYECGCGCASGICAGTVEHGCVRRGRHGMENGKDKSARSKWNGRMKAQMVYKSACHTPVRWM
jgi:hypothetical protein